MMLWKRPVSGRPEKGANLVLELRKLSVDDGMDVYQMLQDIPLDENGLQNNANGLSYGEYKNWLVKKKQDITTFLIPGLQQLLKLSKIQLIPQHLPSTISLI